MEIISENKYANKIFYCKLCGIKFKITNEDLENLIYQLPNGWYERNLSRNDRDVYIKCKCGNIVPIEIWETSTWSHKRVIQDIKD